MEMRIKKVCAVFKNPSIVCMFDLNAKTAIVPKSDVITVFYKIYYETKTGFVSAYRWIKVIGNIDSIISKHDSIKKILSSDKEALLHIKDDDGILSELAKIKLEDFPEVEIPLVVESESPYANDFELF